MDVGAITSAVVQDSKVILQRRQSELMWLNRRIREVSRSNGNSEDLAELSGVRRNLRRQFTTCERQYIMLRDAYRENGRIHCEGAD
ncbi:MAG: hypothetical protein HY396_02145 [Candidatus Doudnabacteria bacterium]|nr:hypothetical protein [Candidatus Doudnabacteria bacterium]